jgi:hypothetical protein
MSTNPIKFGNCETTILFLEPGEAAVGEVSAACPNSTRSTHDKKPKIATSRRVLAMMLVPER